MSTKAAERPPGTPLSNQEIADEILAHGATISVPETGRFLGIGTNLAYELAKADALGVRVLHLGRKLRVPTSDLVKHLGLLG